MNKKLQQRLKEIQQRGVQRRDATVGAINVEARTVELAFSSETEKVERWYGIEVLGHDPHEIDLSRMNNKAPVVWMHDLKDQRGVVEVGTARVDADRIARCTVRFAKDEDGETLFQRIIDGITSKVSVGYTVGGMKLMEERDGIDVYRITSWQPYEVSMCSASADDENTGVGRSVENPPEEQPNKTTDDAGSIKESAATRAITVKEKTPMKYRNYRDAQGNLCRVAVNDEGKDVGEIEVIEKAGAERAAGAAGESARANSILALGEKYDARDLAAQFVRDGKTEADMQDALLKRFNERAAKPLNDQNRNAEVGMSENDIDKYSFLKVIRALAAPNDKRAQEEAAFEIECGREAERKLGKTPQGILIPADVLGSTRQFNAGGVPGTGQGGAHLVPHQTMWGSWIDMLRNRTVMMQLATVMGGLVGTADIPKKTARAQAYWLGEGQDATETSLDFSQITLTPKTLAAYIDITRKLMNQSSPDAEAFVRRDMVDSVALEIDRTAIYGTGTNYQPRGLKNFNGMNAVDFATAQQPTFAELVKMETEIAADNADVTNMAYLGHSRFRGYAKTALKFASAGSATIWEPGNTVNGYRTEITNQVNQADLFFGNFADFIIAMWGGLDMTVDPYSLSKSGGTRVVVFQDVDFAVRRLESFCYGSDTVA